MLREASGIKRVILACGRTDLRKGMDSLAALVRLAYGLDPLEEGTLFLFCGVKKDRLKGLVFEGIGFCLLTIRLTDGKFQWPNTPDEARDITMCYSVLSMRRKEVEIVKFIVQRTSWKKTRNSSESMRLFQ